MIVYYFNYFRKYLRDSEREQLSRQAWTVCVQTLRSRIQSMDPPSTTNVSQLPRADKRTQALLDVYQIHMQIGKKDSQWSESQIYTARNLLVQAYKAYIGTKVSIYFLRIARKGTNFLFVILKNVEGNVVEAALKYCQQANKTAAISILTPAATTTTSATTIVTVNAL